RCLRAPCWRCPRTPGGACRDGRASSARRCAARARRSHREVPGPRTPCALLSPLSCRGYRLLPMLSRPSRRKEPSVATLAFNHEGDAQNTFPIWNATPLIALDVYEHAYYLDYQTDRASYIDAFFDNLDWDAVNAWVSGYQITP